MMFKNLDYSLIALLSCCSRAIKCGATVGDALVIAALAGLYAYGRYLNSQKEIPINEQVRSEIAQLRLQVDTLRDAVGGLKIAKTFNKLG